MAKPTTPVTELLKTWGDSELLQKHSEYHIYATDYAAEGEPFKASHWEKKASALLGEIKRRLQPTEG